MAGALGRRRPPDWRHYELYPLTADIAETLSFAPLVGGFDWYSNFDSPQQDSDGDWWIGRGELGRVRGGHCITFKPVGVRDVFAWWDFYNQGVEGACVGFGASRAMSLVNRRRYVARWLWDRAKEVDYWPDTNPGDDEGTSVRAAMRIMRDRGHVAYNWRQAHLYDSATERATLTPAASEGIAAYRWLTSAQDAMNILGHPGRDYFKILNSWGRAYPHIVCVPADVVQKLIDDYGELGAFTDR
jgi:hypothetical protein